MKIALINAFVADVGSGNFVRYAVPQTCPGSTTILWGLLKQPDKHELASSRVPDYEIVLSQPAWAIPLVGAAIPVWSGREMTLFASERRSYCSSDGSVTCARLA